MVVKGQDPTTPTPGPTPTPTYGRPTASPTPTPSSGEDAGAERMRAMNTPGGNTSGAFSLGQGAWNGKTVYYGLVTPSSGRGSGGRIGEEGTGEAVPMWLTPQQAYEDYFSWSASQRRELIQKGILSGQLQENAGEMEGAAWWKSLVESAARFGAAGNPLSPMGLADGYVQGQGLGMTDQQRFKLQRGSFPSGAIFDSSGKYTRTYRDGQFIVDEMTGTRTYVGPKFKTTTDVHTDLTDPATAKALTTSLFQQLVGRDPGEGELGQFAAALTQAEQAAPVTTSTTNEYNDLGEVVNQTSKTSGGITAEGKQQLLTDKLKGTKEAGVYQAATTYSNALRNLIWGGPGA